MEIVERRTRRFVPAREILTSSLSGGPFALKRCDALGCESLASEHCSAHGVHLCRRHFEHHRAEWHPSLWDAPRPAALC
jgi:hypothetical protein